MQSIIIEKLILLCAKTQSSIAELASINNLLLQVNEWDLFIQRIVRKGYAPLLYSKLPLLPNANEIPPTVTKKLKDAYYKTTSRSLLLQQAFADCVQLFKANNINVIALKGIYLSEYLYQNPALRLMSDIDLLVNVEDGPRSIALLHEMGYKFPLYMYSKSDIITMQEMDLDSGPIHYRQMLKNNVSIEIHIKLQPSGDKKNFNFPIDKIWKNAQKISLYNQDVFTLEFYDLLIHLCLHLKKHFVDMEHVQFSGFADIVNLLCRIDNRQQTTEIEQRAKNKEQRTKSKEQIGLSLTNLEDFEWDELEQRAAEYKCTEIVFGFIALVNKYFSAPVPAEKEVKYRQYLSKYDEKLFLGYLQSDTSNFVKNKSAVRTHFRNMLHLNNGSALHYLFRTIFPGKEFMVKKYLKNKEQRVKNKDKKKLLIINYELLIKFWWLWYPYRWAIGVKELVKLVIKSSR